MKLSCQHVLFAIVISSVACAALLYFYKLSSTQFFIGKSYGFLNIGRGYIKQGFKVNKNSSYSKKWVVITSIFSPTDAINVFSRMPGWQLLVVGDKKTPANWSYPNVIYLGVSDQEKLPYETVRHVPWNRYTRKIIGYLYAIQNGATYIYESDDDNVPNQPLTLFPQSHPHRLIVNTTDIIFNPYAHFGQSSTWPRGYPLNMIGQPVPREYINCPTDPPVVVQSLVNGDPDMDAIFRLTRKYSTVRIDIKFDHLAPLYVHPIGTYSPFNSQNTLFHRKAFWGLVFPISVTDRATDIYRSYWTQRLMWLIGQRLAFGPATFYQKRTGHDILNDFDQEKELYKYMGKFMQALHTWKCSSKVFSGCMLEATRVLVDEKYWTEDDYSLIQAWISDLNELDPSLINHPIMQTNDGCIAKKQFSFVFHPIEQNTSLPHHPYIGMPPFATNKETILDQISAWCNFSLTSSWNLLDRSGPKFVDVALVVSILDKVEEVLPIYESYYKLFFEKIIYCTTSKPTAEFSLKWEPTFIIFKREELSALSCMTAVSLMNMKLRGLFHLGDLMWLNVSQKLFSKNLDLTWLPDNVNTTGSKLSLACSIDNFKCVKILPDLFKNLAASNLFKDGSPFKNLTSLPKILTSLKNTANKFGIGVELYTPTSFTMYLPAKHFDTLYVLKELFTDGLWGNIKLLTSTLFEVHGDTKEFLKTHYSRNDDDSDYFPHTNIFSRLKASRVCAMISNKVEHFKLV